MTSTTSRTATPARHHAGHPVLWYLLARWPSLVALVVLLVKSPGEPDPHVTSMIIVTAAMCYLAAASVGSPRSGWPMVALASVAVVAAGVAGLDPTLVLIVAAAGFTVVGLLRRSRIDVREFVLQAAAFAGFTCLALAAMFAAPLVSVYLAAAAAIGHAVWDAIYWIRGRVVPRSLTEFCFVLDLGLGVLLLLAAWHVLPF
ncbi:hypothetical protein [Rhodococcus rhodnii]|uniref:Uncharacterized protein n=1 Tax=Rhodococcus rhodnii LMG 5362 TaxID=1273125 RepID=R7WS75_9NOCA|nr:hypothetical protein [Rhodococcus rhodnii]EOM78192.1 hypothetical protein Rrhod_0383 [Rhodococcus rhodnii LMG 5362]